VTVGVAAITFITLSRQLVILGESFLSIREHRLQVLGELLQSEKICLLLRRVTR
jgi:hypothetical protein